MLEVKIQQEAATSSKPAKALIYENGRLAIEINARVTYDEGADGRMYPCVVLEAIDNKEKSDECTCTRTCDCQCPEPENGVALISNECPIHNDVPAPSPRCEASVHHAAHSR